MNTEQNLRPAGCACTDNERATGDFNRGCIVHYPLQALRRDEPLQDRTLTITIHNVHGWHLDPGMLEAVLKHCAGYVSAARIIDIYPQERREDGFLEWLVRVIGPGADSLPPYETTIAITIGCVQRVPGNPYEFHS